MVSVLIVLMVLAVVIIPSFAQPATQPGRSAAPSSQAVGEHLARQAHEALAARRGEYEKVKTPDQIAAWQQRLRRVLLEALGEFPQKTPLNAKVTGRIACDGYAIEKVIFESRPGLFVTGLLYLPEAKPPYPAALVPCGHSKNGKAYDAYQRAPILLARNGIAAFCFDPIGQGERSQVLDETGQPMQGSTVEHTLVGTGSILLGRNVAADMVWDGIRAIDYLQSREDIDGSRIGGTGTSGGGTQTSYLMAIDERITCAVPCCYLTSWDRLIDTIGPQDAEQNLFGQTACGLDHADYAILMAPRPLLFGTATRDFFDIDGSWDSFRQAKRIYTRLGFAERVDLVEADLPHNFATELRVPMVQWMRRWLCGSYEPVGEPEATVRPDAELNCTPKGQVMWLPGARSIFDLNAEADVGLAARRREFWRSTSKAQALQTVRRIVAVRPLADLPQPAIEKGQPEHRRSYKVTAIILQPEADLAMPGLLFEPAKATGDAYLYLHGKGKDTDVAPHGLIDALVNGGHSVLAMDLPGIGKLRPHANEGRWDECFGPSAKEFFLAYLVGRSYLGLRVEMTIVAGRWLAAETRRPLHLIGMIEAGPTALHAAALEPDLFASLRLQWSLRSWTDLIRAPLSRNQLINAVHAALKVYDLPDLVGTLPAEKVRIVEPVDAVGEVVR